MFFRSSNLKVMTVFQVLIYLVAPFPPIHFPEEKGNMRQDQHNLVMSEAFMHRWLLHIMHSATHECSTFKQLLINTKH